LTQYNFACPCCKASLRAKPKLAGRKLSCPKCKADIVVPDPPVEATSETAATTKTGPPPATEKQKAYATTLGVVFPDDIDIRAMSKLIDDAQLRQDDERFERLNQLQEAESQVREELRAEVLAECDEEDPRLSHATPEQIMEAMGSRDIGAIMITFEYGVLNGVDDLTGEKFAICSTDDLEDEDLKTILSWLGAAMMRRKA